MFDHPLPQPGIEPPAYLPPRTYTIGSGTVDPPLLNLQQLKGHLALLHEFHNLRLRVENLTSPEYPPNRNTPRHYPHLPEERERKWAWFVGLATQRFRLWYKTIRSFTEIKIYQDMLFPPTDVLMVLHAYMLNPGWFNEDCKRMPIFTSLYRVGELLGDLLPCMPQLLNQPISQTRLNLWNDRCNVPFDPFDYACVATRAVDPILCPRCGSPLWMELMRPDGKGYLQENFSFTCHNCRLEGGKDLLGISKMANDLKTNNYDHTKLPLAGSHFYPIIRGMALRQERSVTIKTRILSAFTDITTPKGCLEKVDYNPDKFFKRCGKHMPKAGGKLLPRICSAYFDDGPFSVDLAAAVLRQCSFTAKMHTLGWTAPHYFGDPEDERALVHCIARYHAFLDLMASHEGMFHVPTLDIDLAWHTHQLMPIRYHDECWRFVGRFVDHDDKVTEEKLSTSFDLTSRAWTHRFGTRYTHCGCPLPGSSVGQRLNSLISSTSSFPSSLLYSTKSPDSMTNPYTSFSHSFISPLTRTNSCEATHPSEHNVVFLIKERDNLAKDRADREKRIKKRIEKDDVNLRVLAGKNKVKNEDIESSRRRSEGDDMVGLAFLTPVPLHFYDPMSLCAPYGNIISGSQCAVGAGVGDGGGIACGSGCGVPDPPPRGSSDTGGGSGSCGDGGGCGGGCGGGGD